MDSTVKVRICPIQGQKTQRAIPAIYNCEFGQKKIAFLFLLCCLHPVSFAQIAGYGYGKEITVDATKVSGSSSLTDFPMLFSVTDNDLRTVANGGRVENTNGYDIIFTHDDCFTLLDHEIEKYDATTGEFVAWVRIPTLHHSTNTEIHIYYGNSSISTNPSTSAVWSSNYENVYHMNQNPSGTAPQITESTSNSYDLTSNGSMTSGDLISGVIGDALDFDGSDDQLTGSSTSTLDNTVTWSGWIYVDGSQTQNDSFTGLFYDGGGVNVHRDTGTGTHSIRLAWNAAWQISTTSTINLNEWFYVAISVNGSTPLSSDDDIIYLGQSGSISTFAYDDRQFGTLDFSSMRIANQNCCGGRFLRGRMDEIRFLSVDLSADWITTEYNNQYSPSTFYSITSEMTATTLCALLPIELVEFRASKYEKNEVILNWTTASETDNAWFDIERSSDGSHFNSIKRLAGAGHSVDLLHYVYIDQNPEVGPNYYRLRQTDYDGTNVVSEIVRVSVEPKTSLKIFPNPTSGDVQLEGPFRPGGTIYVKDIKSRLVKNLTLPVTGSKATISMSGLTKGVYFMLVETKTGIEKHKLIVH